MEETLPEERERETLLSALALLVAKRGASDFLHGPLLLPTPAYFPDEWRPDADGARAMLGRLLAWARLHDRPFTLETWDSAQFFDPRFNDAVGQPLERSGTAAVFLGEHEGSLKFGLDLLRIEDAERLAGVLAHEVAHAWRHQHYLVHDDHAVEERLTDLTTVFLGAGVFTTNNTFRYRSSGGHDWMQYGSEQVGYLSPAAMSFALAVALRVRGSNGGRAHQRPTQESLCDAAVPIVRDRRFQHELPNAAPGTPFPVRRGSATSVTRSVRSPLAEVSERMFSRPRPAPQRSRARRPRT